MVMKCLKSICGLIWRDLREEGWTHIKGCKVKNCMMGSESEAWERMEGDGWLVKQSSVC